MFDERQSCVSCNTDGGGMIPVMGKDQAVSALCRVLRGPDAIGGITFDC